MSNDLISRSALLEELNNFSMRITGSANAMAITIMGETKKSIAKLVDEQPTAYDVDKVAGRLRKEISDCMCDECDGHTDCDTCRAEKAVEIVKSGGIE